VLPILCLFLIACGGAPGSGNTPGDGGADGGTPGDTATPADSGTADGGAGDGGADTGTADGGTGDGGTADTGGDSGLALPCDSPVRVCDGLGCSYDIDARTYTLSGTLSYDGGVIPDTFGTRGQEFEITLIDTASGASFTQGQDGGDGRYAIAVPAGSYELWMRISSPQVVGHAITSPFPLARGVAIRADTSLDLTAEVASIGGSLRFDGDTVPDTLGPGADELTITLVDPRTGLSLDAGQEGGTGTWSASAPPGVYDIWLSFTSADVVSHAITSPFRVATRVRLDGSSRQSLDVQTRSIGGEIRYNGHTIPDTYGSSYDEYTLRFVDHDSSAVIEQSMDGGSHHWHSHLPGGTYDVWLKLNYPGVMDDAVTEPFLVTSDVTVDRDSWVELDAQVHVLSGALLYDGAAVPDTFGRSADELVVQLVDTTSGAIYQTSQDGGTGTYTAVAPSGTYDVQVGLSEPDVMPRAVTTPFPVAHDLVLEADTHLDLSADVAVLTGNLSYNGAPIPDTYGPAYDESVITLIDRASGRSFATGQDGGTGTYAVAAPPGTYDVWFNITYAGVLADAVTTAFPVAREVELDSDRSLDLAPVVQLLSGAVHYNGLPIPDALGTSAHEFTVALQSVTDDTLIRSSLDGGTERYSLPVPSGGWDLLFSLNSADIGAGAVTTPFVVEPCLVID